MYICTMLCISHLIKSRKHFSITSPRSASQVFNNTLVKHRDWGIVSEILYSLNFHLMKQFVKMVSSFCTGPVIQPYILLLFENIYHILLNYLQIHWVQWVKCPWTARKARYTTTELTLYLSHYDQKTVSFVVFCHWCPLVQRKGLVSF